MFWKNRGFGRTARLGQTEIRNTQRFRIRSNSGFTVFFKPHSVVAHSARCAWCVACMSLKRVAFVAEPELIVTAGRIDQATVCTALGTVIID